MVLLADWLRHNRVSTYEYRMNIKRNKANAIANILGLKLK